MEVPRPGWSSKVRSRFSPGRPRPGGVGWLLLAPDVPVPEGGGRVAAGRDEPGVLVGGVVDHEVQNDSNAAFLGLPGQLREVAEVAQPRIHAVVVADVVPVVLPRAGVDGAEPQAAHAEPGEVVQPADQPPQVTDPVTVRVLVGRDLEAVDDSLLVPAFAHT